MTNCSSYESIQTFSTPRRLAVRVGLVWLINNPIWPKILKALLRKSLWMQKVTSSKAARICPWKAGLTVMTSNSVKLRVKSTFMLLNTKLENLLKYYYVPVTCLLTFPSACTGLTIHLNTSAQFTHWQFFGDERLTLTSDIVRSWVVDIVSGHEVEITNAIFMRKNLRLRDCG